MRSSQSILLAFFQRVPVYTGSHLSAVKGDRDGIFHYVIMYSWTFPKTRLFMHRNKSLIRIARKCETSIDNVMKVANLLWVKLITRRTWAVLLHSHLQLLLAIHPPFHVGSIFHSHAIFAFLSNCIYQHKSNSIVHSWLLATAIMWSDSLFDILIFALPCKCRTCDANTVAARQITSCCANKTQLHWVK